MSDDVCGGEELGARALYSPGSGPGEYESLLTEMNYEKGAWVLHMLRRLVGDEAFFQGVRDYYAALRDRTAWTADFARIMEAASGQSLERYFDQWVARPGMPMLAASVVGEGGERRLRIEQLQDGPPYALVFDVDLRWDDGSERRVVEMDASRVEVPLPREGPVRVVLDPEGWLLFVDRSLPTE